MNSILGFFISISTYFSTSPALAITKLGLVSPIVNQLKIKDPVQTQVEFNGQFLRVQFDIQSEQINSKPIFLANEYPFQFDVAELFLSVGKNPYPYYEFEISPHNQVFVVRIDGPKKFVNNVIVDWTHSAQLTPQGWRAEMTIDLSKLNWDQDVSKIKGNLYVITGKAPNRHFWSLNLPKMKKPNFHSPQYFKPLVDR